MGCRMQVNMSRLVSVKADGAAFFYRQELHFPSSDNAEE